jgi:phage recombination protein Bet
MSLEFTEKELAAIRSEYCKGATDAQFDLFISECQARSLRPGVHLVFQLRNAKEWDPVVGASVFVKKPFWITTIAALRLIAQRTGEYLGQGPDEFVYLDDNGFPTIKSEIPLPISKTNPVPREPWVARAKVYRKGFTEPMVGMARFEAYAGTRKDGNEIVLTDMWAKRGSEQLQKCAEALALRKAFAEEMSGLLILEELRETEEPAHQNPIAPSAVIPSLPEVPKVDQTPATGTATPRPGETKPTPETAAQIREAIPVIEKVLENPEVKKQLAAEGKQVNQAAIDQLKKDVGLTIASELPTPRKRGRKPKSPENGQPVPVPGELTDEDTAQIGPPTPVPATDPETAKREAEAFVESLDPTPTKEEQAGFSARVRALVQAGASSADLKNYILNLGNKSEPKELTVGNWKTALDQLEAALAESKDKLKEVTKNAPLPEKF